MILPRRLRAAPLLLLLLTAGPVAAAAHGSREARPSRLSVTGVLSEVWTLVCRIWGKEGGSGDPFGKSGSSGDPFGQPTPSPQPPADGTSAAEPAPGK